MLVLVSLVAAVPATAPSGAQEPPVLRTWEVSATLFGFTAFDVLGDVDGDGDPELLVGDAGYSTAGLSLRGRMRVLASSGAVLFEHLGTVPNQILGSFARPVGDVDGDGREDYMESGRPVDPARIRSGASGAVLFTASLGAQDAAGLGDLDGDGLDDFALGRLGQVRLFRGGSFQIHATIAAPPETFDFGARVLALGDVDGDGACDLAIGALGEGHKISPPGEVLVHSGRTGALLHRVPGHDQNDHFGQHMAAPGDLTGDGVGELVVGTSVPFLAHGRLTFLDGPTGVALAPSPLGEASEGLDASGDVNGDGLPDLVRGARGAFTSPTIRVEEGVTGEVLFAGPRGPFDLVAGGAHDWNGDTFPDFLLARTSRIELLSGAPPRTAVAGAPCFTALAREPRIGATGAPALGQPYRLHLADVPPFVPAVLRLALDTPGNLAAPGARGCALLGPALAEIPVVTAKIGPNRGAATVLIPIPADPALLDQRLAAQWRVLDSTGRVVARTRVLRPRVGP
ncbi:MAG TPA: VCBS repeat-containing protein [Planctomycetota bacterium]